MTIAILCLILVLAAASITFLSATYGTALAFLALCTAGLLPGVEFTAATYIFWGIAMLIVVAIGSLLPAAVASSRKGVPYIGGGALAGAFAGMALGSHAAIIIGAVAGALLGGVAYGRTPAGKALLFPSSRFFNYLCAKGLPAAVAMSMAALSAGLLIAAWPR